MLFETKAKNWVYQAAGGWKVNIDSLYKNIVFNSSIIRSNKKDIFFFIEGAWKQYSEEEFIRLLTSLLKRVSFQYAKQHIAIPPAAVKQLYFSCLAHVKIFPEDSEILNIMSDGYYKVITKNFIYKISPIDYKLIKEKNEGQYYNFAVLENFENDLTKKIELSPTIKKFFNNITAGDNNYLLYLQELIGSCLLNQTAPEPYIYILHGPGKNGKSVFIRLLSYIVNHKKCSVEFSNINEQNIPMFESHYINCPSEISDKSFSSSLLKAISSGDPVGANEKYKNPRTILPIAKQVASANKLPNLNDSSEGMWRRLQILPFDFKITSINKIDENTLIKEFQEQSENLRAWAFEGLVRFIQNKGIHTKVMKVLQETLAYRQDENNVYQFLDSFLNCLIDNFNDLKNKKPIYFNDEIVKQSIFKYDKGELNDPKVKISDLYLLYRNWCHLQGYRPLNVKNFKLKALSEFNRNWETSNYSRDIAIKFQVFLNIKVPVEVVYQDDNNNDEIKF